MIKDNAKVSIDWDATNKNVLSIVKEKGFSLSQYNKIVKDMSVRYRNAVGVKRLSKTDKYVIISQVLHVRLDDLFVLIKE